METSALFIQSQLYNYELMQKGKGVMFQFLCGAVLGITTMPPSQFATARQEKSLIIDLVKLSLETIKQLANIELIKKDNVTM